jgi:hypothetical protein
MSDELRNAFKAYCAARGKTMRDVMIELIRQKLKEADRKK